MISRTRTLLLGAALLTLGSAVLHAQTQIGSRYVGLGLTKSDDRRDPQMEAEGVYLSVNLPVTTGVDFKVGYSTYDMDSEWFVLDEGENPISPDQDGRVLTVGALFYKSFEHYKAYSSVRLGYERLNVKLGSFDESDSAGFWGVEVGVEWQATEIFSAGAFVSHSNTFSDFTLGEIEFNPGGRTVAGIFTHLRFHKRVGLEASFAWDDEATIHFSIGTTFTF